MAVIYENIGNGIIRAYSNAGFMIHGGMPEGDYAVVYDPEEAGRTYIETTIPIDETPEPSQYRSFSKIRLKMAIAKAGLLQAFETMLSSIEIAPGYTALDAWNDAQVIRDDFEGFNGMIETIKTSLGVSNEIIEQILSSAAV